RTFLGNATTLAPREAASRDNERVSQLTARHRRQRLVRSTTHAKRGRGYAGPRHEVFCERLARRQRRGRFGWSNNQSVTCHEQVCHSAAERQLGPDDGHLHLLTFGDRKDRRRITYIARHAARKASNADVARGTDDLLYVALAGELPCKRVLAGAAADNEDSHRWVKHLVESELAVLQGVACTTCKETARRP